MSKYDYTTEGQVRRAFWEGNEHLRARYKSGKRQNEYNATIRMEWCEYVEMLVRNGHISASLADRVTL